MSFTWTPSFGWLNLALDLVIVAGGLGAAYLALGRKRGRTLLQETGVFVQTLSIVAAAWLPVVIMVGGILGFCFGARVAWTTATVTGPLCALWGAWRHQKAWPVAVALVLLGAKYYGEVLEPNDLEVQRVEIRLAGLKAPVKLVHLSDLQNDAFGPLQARVQAESNAFQPDLVVFTGDAVNHESLKPAFAKYLAGFTHRRGKFFVSGDVDGDLSPELAEGGFQFLDDRALQAAGLGFFGVPVVDSLNRELIVSLSRKVPAPRVLVSHRPDAVFSAVAGVADLVLAGHTHGGQVCLPFFGPIVTLTKVSRAIAAGGLHRYEDTQILLSRGLGWEGHVAPRLRFFCRPHLLLATLLPVLVVEPKPAR